MIMRFVAASIICSIGTQALAGNGSWTEMDFQGEPGISYDGPNFGIIMFCNTFGNLEVRLLADKYHFEPVTVGQARLGGGALVVLRDGDDVVVSRRAFREDDVGQLSAFSGNLTPAQVDEISHAKRSITIAILEDGVETSFVAVSETKDFRSSSSSVVDECQSKYN